MGRNQLVLSISLWSALSGTGSFGQRQRIIHSRYFGAEEWVEGRLPRALPSTLALSTMKSPCLEIDFPREPFGSV